MSNLTPLREVSRLWGADKVEHYGWDKKGRAFCAALRSAACVVRSWDEAVVKLNRLILRRAPLAGRVAVEASAAPVMVNDLVNLSNWWHQSPYIAKNDKNGISLSYCRLGDAELPVGFCFDKFGLLIRTAGPSATLHGVAVLLTEAARRQCYWKSSRSGAWTKLSATAGPTRDLPYCLQLRTAARVVRNWDEAAIKINRLILRRIALSGRLGVSSPVNLIIVDDLENLKSWSSKATLCEEERRGM